MVFYGAIIVYLIEEIMVNQIEGSKTDSFDTASSAIECAPEMSDFRH